ncbi:MAG TPA: hypothetical protein VN634_14520 [Candidatus Limnocylindrales bacterium]|nr:hypothetical protein [Candidatus Limnocylindrales bacterium]
MHRNLTIAALALVPLLLTGCEKKTETATAPAAIPAPPATPAPASAGARTVAFELESTSAVGALQIDIAYTGDGRFVGDADAVACETKVPEALSSYNHITGDKLLRAAFVAVKGFTGPVRFSECKFQGNPKPADFTVTIKDSSSPDLGELKPPPSIKVVVN